jgi:hypothetical protein
LDGSLADHRAFVFANTTTDAQFTVHNWNQHCRSLLAVSSLLEPDRFFGKGTHLLADDAIPVICPGDTEILIDVR